MNFLIEEKILIMVVANKDFSRQRKWILLTSIAQHVHPMLNPDF